MRRVPTHAGDWHALIAFQDIHVPTVDVETATAMVLHQAAVPAEAAARVAAAVGIAATLYGGASVARLSGHVIHVDYRLQDGRFEILLHRAADEPDETVPTMTPENGGWQAVRDVFEIWGRPPGAVMLASDLPQAREPR